MFRITCNCVFLKCRGRGRTENGTCSAPAGHHPGVPSEDAGMVYMRWVWAVPHCQVVSDPCLVLPWAAFDTCWLPTLRMAQIHLEAQVLAPGCPFGPTLRPQGASTRSCVPTAASTGSRGHGSRDTGHISQATGHGSLVTAQGSQGTQTVNYKQLGPKTAGTSNQGSLATVRIVTARAAAAAGPGTRSQEACTCNACPRNEPHPVKCLTVAHFSPCNESRPWPTKPLRYPDN